jgi:hypothetical protein
MLIATPAVSKRLVNGRKERGEKQWEPLIDVPHIHCAARSGGSLHILFNFGERAPPFAKISESE